MSGSKTRIGRNRKSQADRLVLLVIMFVALTVAGNGFALAAVADDCDQHEYAYYTERYWAAAADRENRLAAQETGSQYSYYTERYWQAAATREADLAWQETGSEYSYYTERYWQAAAAREAELVARVAGCN